MKFFIDECISPSLSRHLNETGLHDAIHPRDRARLREPDHVVFARAIAEDGIIVTENTDDFRKLAAGVDLHPGLIILPSARAEAQRLMDLVVQHLFRLNPDRPQDAVVNSAVTIGAACVIRIDPLAIADRRVQIEFGGCVGKRLPLSGLLRPRDSAGFPFSPDVFR